MNKRTIVAFVALSFAFLAFVTMSCQRDPIFYPTSDYYVGIEVEPDSFDEDFVMPSVYVASFYDVNDGKLVYSTFLRGDQHPADLPMGGYVAGIEPGEYDLLVYSYNLRRSEINESNSWNRVYANANLIGRSNGVRVTYAPDYIYLYSDRIKVPYITEDDGVFIIGSKLESIVDTWNVIVCGIRNLDIAESVTFYISGQAGGRYLGLDHQVNERSIVTFDGSCMERVFPAVSSTKAFTDSVGLVAAGRYTSFGMLENVERVLLTVQIIGPNGSSYFGQFDVTDQLLDENNVQHLIVVYMDEEIKEREDGGFNPEAKPWDPDVTQIILE